MNKVVSSIRLTRRDPSPIEAVQGATRTEAARSQSSLLLGTDGSTESAAEQFTRPPSQYEIPCLPRSSSQPKLFKHSTQLVSCPGSQEPSKRALLVAARKPEFFRIMPNKGSLNTVEDPNEDLGLGDPATNKPPAACGESRPVSSSSGTHKDDCLDQSSCLTRLPANNIIFIRKPKLSVQRATDYPSAGDGFEHQTPSRLAGPAGRSKCLAKRLEGIPPRVFSSAMPVSPLKSALRTTRHHRDCTRKPSGLSQRSLCISTSASIEPSTRRAVAFSPVLQIRVFSCNA